MIVQLPDGTLWQDNGDGTYSQIATGFDDPAAAGIDPGTVTQLDTLPGPSGQPPPIPTQGTFPVGPISTPEEAAQIAAQGPLEPAPGQTTSTRVPPPPPVTASLLAFFPAPATPPAPGIFQPAGVAASWRALLDGFTSTLPAANASLAARADALKSIFG